MRKNKPDPHQRTFDELFEKKLDNYIEQKIEIQKAIDEETPSQPVENEFEACIEIAAAIKSAIKEWGQSREQFVDEINKYFGRTKQGVDADPPLCRNQLTISMLNNYLSKPVENPIPAYFLYAVHRITKSLEPARVIVSAEGAKIATGREVRQMTLGKLEENINEMQQLKRELKGKR